MYSISHGSNQTFQKFNNEKKKSYVLENEQRHTQSPQSTHQIMSNIQHLREIVCDTSAVINIITTVKLQFTWRSKTEKRSNHMKVSMEREHSAHGICYLSLNSNYKSLYFTIDPPLRKSHLMIMSPSLHGFRKHIFNYISNLCT